MKNIVLALISATFTLIISTNLSASAGVPSNDQKEKEALSMESYIHDIEGFNIEIELQTVSNVEIYNQDNNLVKSGNENDEEILKLTGISDLLTEVQGIKFYRLSYI